MTKEQGDTSSPAVPLAGPANLWDVARFFLRLGLTAFGGPAAHIAMMEEELVHRRKWLSQERFLDLLGATNLIPGPNSTELAIHIGFLRAGWPGLALGGICFILPAALMVSLIACLYVRFGKLPEVAGALYGVKPVVVVIVLGALWKLGRTALKTKLLGVLGLLTLALAFLQANQLALLLGAGVGAGLIGWYKEGPRRRMRTLAPLLLLAGAVPFLQVASLTGASGHTPFSLGALFFYFLKIGSILYGSGYVLLAFLQSALVEHWHWLTAGQLLDATAVGQVTPGPVFTTATFIGYVLAGPVGAVVATVGIFLPSFLFIALSGPLIPRLRRSAVAGAFLDGVNVASLALMAAVTWLLGRDGIHDPATILLAAASAILLFRFRVNATWLVLGGAVVGALVRAALA